MPAQSVPIVTPARTLSRSAPRKPGHEATSTAGGATRAPGNALASDARNSSSVVALQRQAKSALIVPVTPSVRTSVQPALIRSTATTVTQRRLKNSEATKTT